MKPGSEVDLDKRQPRWRPSTEEAIMLRAPRRRGSLSSDLRTTIHQLNQRYREQGDRAEALQAELDSIKGSRAWRWVCWCRLLLRWFRPPSPAAPTLSYAVEPLDDFLVAPRGQVSIIIPFRDQPALLRNCLRSLRQSTYRPHEIVLIDNGSTDPRLHRYLERLRDRPRFRVLSCPGEFNFSRLCNLGARRARGDFLLFLNNDVEVLTPDWLEHLLQLGCHPKIGVVGATLLYPDATLQHAGIFPRSDGQWRHAFRGLPHDCAGQAGELRRVRAVPAVTGACLLMRRDRFVEIGGFSEAYPITCNDVDLCGRARQRGWKVAITPHARLWHFESLSRGYNG